jgi:hypothetical protein
MVVRSDQSCKASLDRDRYGHVNEVVMRKLEGEIGNCIVRNSSYPVRSKCEAAFIDPAFGSRYRIEMYIERTRSVILETQKGRNACKLWDRALEYQYLQTLALKSTRTVGSSNICTACWRITEPAKQEVSRLRICWITVKRAEGHRTRNQASPGQGDGRPEPYSYRLLQPLNA